MAEEGYYELQVLDHSGWALRSRFPTSSDDPMVVMRARAEAEQAAQEPDIRGVELVYEFMDTKTQEVRREPVYAWGNARATQSTIAASTSSSRRSILRTARAEGRVRGLRGRAAPKGRRPISDDAEPIAPPESAPAPRGRRATPWWRKSGMIALGSLLLAIAAGAAIWIGLAQQLQSTAVLDTQPVQAGFLTVILLFGLAVLVWVQRRGIGALLKPPPAVAAAPAPVSAAIIEVPAAVAPAPPKPRPMAPGDAMVEVQQNRLLRFLRDCLLHKDMRAAFASDGKLTDPHIVHGCHLFMLGAAEVCVTDTSSGISDRSHLVRVMKALMRAIGSPEDRAEAFVGDLERFRKKPEEHTMILLGQLAMDHYLENNQVPDGALSKAMMRWSAPHGDV